ncbi:fimbria/pilus outer membrane usher protein [Klebsiella pneumoniae]|nr:fimbria/pilus outer membrane usher protein [Klebsiella pneumoniae]
MAGPRQLQYSKGFDRLGTQFTFTGWRYSHQRYATLSEAFSSPGSEDDLQDSDNKKATLQITASQSLPYDITLYLSLDRGQLLVRGRLTAYRQYGDQQPGSRYRVVAQLQRLPQQPR